MTEDSGTNHDSRCAMIRGNGLMVVLASVVALVLAGQLGIGGDTWNGTVLFGPSFLLLGLTGLVLSAAVLLSRHVSPGERRPWRFMVAAWLMNVVTSVGFAIAGGPATEHVAASVAIGSRLLMVPTLLAAVLTFPMPRLTTAQRYRLALDLGTVAGGGFMVTWYFIVGPALAAGGPMQASLTLAGFPLGDLILVFGLCAVLLRRGVSSPAHPLTLLLGGLSLYLVGDLAFTYDQIHGAGPDVPMPAGLSLLTGTSLMVIAAARQLRESSTSPGTDREQRQPVAAVSHLPYLALATGYLLLLVATVREGDMFPWGGLVAGAIIMTSTVATRQLIAMRENHDLVLTDNLTGLANRARLRIRLQQITGRREQAAVLLIDLDGFKQVNDTLGHEAGDTLLRSFAHALHRCLRQTDLAARIGGDEFVVILDKVTDVAQAAEVADRILGAAAVPIELGDSTVAVRASIGVALSRLGDTPHGLLHRADTAMYAAKRARTHSWAVYHEDMEQGRADADALSADLEAAVAEEQLRVLYQPIVTLTTGELTAVEALVRWQHPTRGLLTPDVFIPLAEDNGTIHRIGMWVLQQTCRQVRQWQQTLPPGKTLYASVNLSPHQLHRPSLTHEVLDVLRDTGLDPHHLVLELTEGALVNEDRGIPQLHALREHGIRIAIDDFGTGYSSLRYLTRLPVDILKLDRCFVTELNGSAEGSAVAEAVIRLSQILHLDTVAEGIEDPSQAAELTLLGCRTGQGYLFARPMQPEALQAILQTTTMAEP